MFKAYTRYIVNNNNNNNSYRFNHNSNNSITGIKCNKHRIFPNALLQAWDSEAIICR